MSVRHFTRDDPKYYQYADRQIYVGDVVDASSSDTMSVGYYRNKRKGERNEWIVTYDEALVVTKGALIVHSADGTKTAKAGEILFLTKGRARPWIACRSRRASKRSRSTSCSHSLSRP